MEEGQASADVENVEGNEEIDIYVFSNGQQYSPPRKYHLRTEELNYWEVTLNFLARSQYGSLAERPATFGNKAYSYTRHSSIELFELDGRKLEKPTDIRDCAVYVAVVPPDPFIYAGYDKYLVKASRSYERRFSKIVNGEQATDTNSQPKDAKTASVKCSEIGPQYLTIRKMGEVRKSSLKNSSQKLVEKIKPVANQVSQRQPRKSNISSDLATKKNYNCKRDPKICSKISTAPGMPGKSSTSTRDGSVATRKSPAKTLSFDTSVHKENDTHQKLVNSKHESFNINKNYQDPSNKPNTPTSFQTSKLNNNTSTIKNDQSLSGKKDSIVDEILNPHLDNPHILVNNLRKSVNVSPKTSLKQRNSGIGKITPLLVDEKLQSTKKDRISFTGAIKLPTVDKMQGQLVRPIPMSSNETSSVKEQLQQLTSNERACTANKTIVSKIVRELNDRLNASGVSGIPKATNTNKVSVVNENKLTATDDMLILTDNRQSPVNHKTIESIEKQVEIDLLDDLHYSTVRHDNSVTSKPFISFSDEMKEINNRDFICNTNETIVLVPEEKSFNDQNYVNGVTKSTTTFSQLQTAKSIEMNTAIFEDVSDNDGKDRIILINKTKNNKKDDSIKANLDLISILNETRVSTEPQSFILKSEEARESKSKERFIIINDNIDQVIKPNSSHNYIMQKSTTLAVYETTKTNTDPITPVVKINVSTVEATPKQDYVNISDGNRENKMNTTNNSTLQTNNNKNPSLVSENLNDLKVPMLYHVPEKTLKLIVQDENVDKDALTNKSTVETENMDATKTHSFTFYIKKDSDNTVKVTDMKSNVKKEMVKLPLNNIVKDKDIVHVNIFRSWINNSMSTCIDGTDQKPCKIQKCKDEDNNDMEDDCPSECTQCLDSVQLKETDMTTTFINPAWDKNNTNVSLKTESDTDQFIAIVQNGDIVNLKLSIQIKDAAGILKSTHKIDIRNSSSVNKLPSDEINKTPNELTRSKSLQSVENDSPPHLCCRKKDKVVIYQCACCENTNYTLAVNPLNPSLQGLYVLLPVATPVQESARTNNQTSDKQVQYTESLTKISVVGSVKDTLLTFPGDNVQAKTSEISSKRQVLIGEQGTIHSQLIMVRTEPSQMSSHFNAESKIQQTSRTTKDEFTQTDWCDVLLEARAEPDGHYTFYLPPLHLLQQYTLQ